MAPAKELDEAAPLLGATSSSSTRSSAVDMASDGSLESGGKTIQSHAEPTTVSTFWEPGADQGGPSALDESDFVTVKEDRDLKRGLHQRHVSLIAIAGAIVCPQVLTFRLALHATKPLPVGDWPLSRSWRIDTDWWSTRSPPRLRNCRPDCLLCPVCARRSDGITSCDRIVRSPC